MAVLSSFANADGSAVAEINGRLVLTLVNIGRESAAAAVTVATKTASGGYVRNAAPLNLNLYLMVSASFANYLDALTMLSAALGFFRRVRASMRRAVPTFPRSWTSSR